MWFSRHGAGGEVHVEGSVDPDTLFDWRMDGKHPAKAS
jgi:hypothetical protein